MRERMRALVRGLLAAFALIAVAGCSEPGGTRDPGAERGRQIYLTQCIACHNTDPALAGPVGPPVRGSSRELLEAKILKGTYPPGYAPKRPTTLMPPQPALARDIGGLAAYLK
jgi:mono/diheme cytochrome c family protein